MADTLRRLFALTLIATAALATLGCGNPAPPPTPSTPVAPQGKVDPGPPTALQPRK